VVEDSPTVRAHLVTVLGSDPQMEVVGEAADGQSAIELCQRLRPDVMTLDMMLPILSGLAATQFIMAHFPTPILVVSASFNRGEMFKTYDALASGAVDAIEKPTGLEAPGSWERTFLSAVRVVSRVKVVTRSRAREPGWCAGAAGDTAPSRASPTQPARSLVVIGVSTGGPSALVQLLRELPKEVSPPILIVMHIARPFATAFADWLGEQTGRVVQFAADGESLASLRGAVRLAPPDCHMILRSRRLALTHDPERHSCRPSVDELFESVASGYGAATVACLLTGMGRDGAQGLLALRLAGALTIAQDEATSIVYGMPREAVSMGAALHVLPLGDVAKTLVTACRDVGDP
jgi:two-component system chemotaxis response regulator CheB